jgi:hypothetical protein
VHTRQFKSKLMATGLQLDLISVANGCDSFWAGHAALA